MTISKSQKILINYAKDPKVALPTSRDVSCRKKAFKKFEKKNILAWIWSLKASVFPAESKGSVLLCLRLL